MKKSGFDNNNYLIGQLSKLFEQIMLVSNIDFDEGEISRMSEFFVDGVIFDRMSIPQTPEDLTTELRDIRKLLNTIIQSVDSGFEKSIKKVDNIYQNIEKLKKFREKYPIYVNPNHPIDCLKFYNKLNKEEYDFSETGELLGLTRQTISTHFNNGMFLKVNPTNGKKISKESIYLYFVKRNFLSPKVKK